MFSKLSLYFSSDNLIAFIKFSVMLSHFHIWSGKDIQLICFGCGNSLSKPTFLKALTLRLKLTYTSQQEYNLHGLGDLPFGN